MRLPAIAGLAVAGLAVVALATIVVTGGGEESTSEASNSTATTEIRRMDLVETESEDGTLGYADSEAVLNRLSGTVTWLPREGRVIEPGEALYKVDDTPVVLLRGAVPAYRTLDSSVSDGPDVEQLERNLRELGYDEGGAMAVDGEWDWATTDAVIDWQEAHGLEQTGSIELGRVVFQPGKRRVESLAMTLGGDPAAGTSGAAWDGAAAPTTLAVATSPSTMPTTTTPAPETTPEQESTTTPEQETTTTPEHGTSTTPEQETTTMPESREHTQTQPGAESNQQPPAAQAPSGAPSASGARTSAGGETDSGAGAVAVTEVMTTSSTRPVVTVDLDTSLVTLAKVGAPVSVELPSGERQRGTVSAVSKVATAPEDDSTGAQQQEQQSSSDDATVAVTIRLAKRTPALDEAPVSVAFERSRARDVLAIPVTALLAQAGGTFAVELREGGDARLVAVEPGLYASGYVEIEGEGLRPGMRVTDARV
jgi:hypothetical protein